jgi:hypothetical protein
MWYSFQVSRTISTKILTQVEGKAEHKTVDSIASKRGKGLEKSPRKIDCRRAAAYM